MCGKEQLTVSLWLRALVFKLCFRDSSETYQEFLSEKFNNGRQADMKVCLPTIKLPLEYGPIDMFWDTYLIYSALICGQKNLACA